MDYEGLEIYDYCHKRLFNYCRLNGYSATNTYTVYKAIEKHYAIHSPTYLKGIKTPLSK